MAQKVLWRKALVIAMTTIVGSNICWADDAEVLPKGVSWMRFQFTHYLPIEEQFGPDGKTEDIGTDFTRNLNSSVFPALGQVEAGFGLPTGSATLGNSDVNIDFDIDEFELTYGYGVTNRVTVGVKVPYFWLQSNVDASVDSSNATVGLNPLFGTGADPFGVPIVPTALGGTPVTTEDIQQILGPGLSINGTPAVSGFGFERFESWSDNGLGDVEVQARYQYFRNEKWRIAFTGGVRFPTGNVDDPDNLVDLPFGEGAYALLFRFNQDFIGLKKWLFNFTFKYDLYLPTTEEKRVPDDVNQPLTTNEERVDIKPGNIFEVDLKAAYSFTQTMSAFLRYRYRERGKSDVDGNMGFNYASLEAESDFEDQQVYIGFVYSTLAKYMQTKKGIPFSVNIQYRDRIGGENVLDSQFIRVELNLFFK